MFQDWVVIVAAFGYIWGPVRRWRATATASHGRLVRAAFYLSAIARDLLHIVDVLRIGRACREDDILIRDPDVGPVLMIGGCMPVMRRIVQSGQDPEHHLDRGLHRCALRQRPGRGDRRNDRHHRLAALHFSATESRRLRTRNSHRL